MEWEAGLLDKATVALNVYNAFKAYREAGGGSKWVDRNRGAFSLITWIKKARGDYG